MFPMANSAFVIKNKILPTTDQKVIDRLGAHVKRKLLLQYRNTPTSCAFVFEFFIVRIDKLRTV